MFRYAQGFNHQVSERVHMNFREGESLGCLICHSNTKEQYTAHLMTFINYDKDRMKDDLQIKTD